jgi:hypothetical protein
MNGEITEAADNQLSTIEDAIADHSMLIALLQLDES